MPNAMYRDGVLQRKLTAAAALVAGKSAPIMNSSLAARLVTVYLGNAITNVLKNTKLSIIFL